MNPKARSRGRSPRGDMLLECLVYCALFAVILSLAVVAVFRGVDASKRLRRNASDIALALDAGERWRADVRAATGPLRLTTDGGRQALQIPQRERPVTYTFDNGALVRRVGADGPGVRLLTGLKTSQMVEQRVDQVRAWRWEVELGSRQGVQLRPLFSFLAVAEGDRKP